MTEFKIDLSFGLGESLKPIAQTVSGLAEALFQPPASALGELAKNQINWWNFQNVARKVKLAKEIITENGIAEHSIEPSFLIPWLRAAADADDPKLDDLWAQLLANAAATGSLHPLYVQTLRYLTPGAARLLERIDDDDPCGWHWYDEHRTEEPDSVCLDGETLRTVGLLDPSTAFCNDPPDTPAEKQRLRAIKESRARDGLMRLPPNPDRMGRYRISPFGRAFLNAVRKRSRTAVTCAPIE